MSEKGWQQRGEVEGLVRPANSLISEPLEHDSNIKEGRSVNGWVCGWMNGWVHEWVGGWMNEFDGDVDGLSGEANWLGVG